MSERVQANWAGLVGEGWHVVVRGTVCRVLGHSLQRRRRFDAVCTRCAIRERLW